jgi:ABC-2 type transport system ATP-binding protein
VTTLKINGISKNYGDRRVLDGVTFDVAPGRLTGFVGGNGAGKTTTMRIILGLLAADEGTVTRGGKPLTAESRHTFGYMPEERGLYPKMKVLDQIVYFARLHGMSKADATSTATELLTELGLGERLNDNVEALSLGNQQRAQIAASLVHNPEVLILDEPFSGLDPIAVETVAAVLQERAAAGVSVLFSSHQLELVERLCDNLVILADGGIRASGPREKLREQFSEPRWEIQTTVALGWLTGEAGVTLISQDASGAVFDADSAETAQRVLRRALEAGPVAKFGPLHPTLAQIFKEVIQ